MRNKSLKNGFTLSLAILAAVALLSFGTGRTQAAPTTLVVDDDSAQCSDASYSTIQAAVVNAAPGDTIKVCAGTYTGVVNVPITLTFKGAQSGVDARTRVFNAATEAIVTDGFSVTADGVVIDGFTIQGVDGAGDFGTGISLSALNSGYTITNNIIQDNIFGIYLNSSGASQTIVSHNSFASNNRPGSASGNAIYADGGSKNIQITENRFTGHSSAAMVFASVAPNSQSGITISGNDFVSDNSIVLFNLTNSSITCNRSVNSQGSTIFIGGGVSGLTIANNSLLGSPFRAIRIPPDFFGFPTPNSNITVSNNNIAGNVTAGIDVTSGRYTGTLKAENNWWGSPTGPTSPSNPGGTGDKVIDPDGVVDFTPWSTAPQADVDNDGILDACDAQIGPPTSKDQCKNEGWKNYNFPHTFKNQGDCIQAVNTGK